MRAALCHAGMCWVCSSAQRCYDVRIAAVGPGLIKLLMAEGSVRGTCSTEPWPLVAADRPQASVLPVCILFTTRMVRLKWKNDLYGARRLVSSEIWCRDGFPRYMRVLNGDRAWFRLFKFHVARTARYEHVIDRYTVLGENEPYRSRVWEMRHRFMALRSLEGVCTIDSER